jgi:class 3 adenylate cyclase
VRDRKHDKQEILRCLWQSAVQSLSEVRRGKMRPHRRFARIAAPRSLVTRHLLLPIHLKLHQRLPRFVSRRSSQNASTAIDGERKTVTALFADIKGSMELMENLDPEEARAIVDPALKLMMDAVHHYGGYVAQSTGDGIFALFGAPIAHEDHPQRALSGSV